LDFNIIELGASNYNNKTLLTLVLVEFDDCYECDCLVSRIVAGHSSSLYPNGIDQWVS
jgi:hypothetical protein